MGRRAVDTHIAAQSDPAALAWARVVPGGSAGSEGHRVARGQWGQLPAGLQTFKTDGRNTSAAPSDAFCCSAHGQRVL